MLLITYSLKYYWDKFKIAALLRGCGFLQEMSSIMEGKNDIYDNKIITLSGYMEELGLNPENKEDEESSEVTLDSTLSIMEELFVIIEETIV